MAKKKANENKGIIASICAIVVLIVVIIAVVVAVNVNRGLDDSYFVSDGTKYVLTIDTDEALLEDDGIQPVKTHIVYTYSGDEITGMKTYSEYKDNAAAQNAYNELAEVGEDMANFTVDGKYLIMTATADQYEGVTATDVKAQIEFFETLKNMNLDEMTTDTTDDETVNAGEEATVEETQE